MTNLTFTTLDILALKYRDKTYGNTYFSAQVYLDYGLPTQQSFRLPYQYGYGSQFEQEVLEELANMGKLPVKSTCYSDNTPLSLCELREKGVIVRSFAIWSKKKNVKDLGDGKYSFAQLCDD